MVTKVYMASYYEPYEKGDFFGLFYKLEDAKAACQAACSTSVPLEWTDRDNESVAFDSGGGEFIAGLEKIT